MSNFDGSASWAEVAARGPPQSEEEAHANPVDELIPTTTSIESLVDVDSGVSVVPSDFPERDVKTKTQATRIELENAAAEAAAEAAAVKGERPKKDSINKRAKLYAGNPVIAINAVGVAGASVLLMLGAYKKHRAGALTCKTVGLWTAGLAVVGCVDYFVSSYLFKKYPPKSK